jgi:hypothetical protein
MTSMARSTSSYVLVGDDELEPQLGPEVQDLRRPAIVLDDARLAAGAEHVGHRHARQSDRVELGTDRLERLVADICLDLLHVSRHPRS